MIVSIILRKEEVALEIKKGEKVISASKWEEKNNLSQKLLSGIDNLLEKSKIDKKKVKLKVISEVPEKFTTTRIAKAVEKSWNFGVSSV